MNLWVPFFRTTYWTDHTDNGAFIACTIRIWSSILSSSAQLLIRNEVPQLVAIKRSHTRADDRVKSCIFLCGVVGGVFIYHVFLANRSSFIIHSVEVKQKVRRKEVPQLFAIKRYHIRAVYRINPWRIELVGKLSYLFLRGVFVVFVCLIDHHSTQLKYIRSSKKECSNFRRSEGSKPSWFKSSEIN